MKRFLKKLRLYCALQLLPALESPSEETLIGGQAVLEGVMMRSPHAWGIAVRKPTGEITTHCEALERPSEKHEWMAWPFMRGLITLGQAMKLGYRAIMFSANVALGDLMDKQPEVAKAEAARAPETQQPAAAVQAPPQDTKPAQMSGWVIAGNMLLSIGFFIFLYKFVPLVAATRLTHTWPAMNNNIVFSLVDGAIRLGLFLLFIWGISLFADIKRLYEYHGAEHKTVFAYEARHDIPSAEFTQHFST